MAIYAGVARGLEGSAFVGGAVPGAIVAESVGYGTAALWEQAKQLGAVDMSRGDADATRLRASVVGVRAVVWC